MRTTAALAMALVLCGGCKPKRAANDAATDAHTPSRPSASVVQLAPALDGWRSMATLTPGSDPGVGVVLVHQLGSNRGEWAPLVAKLQEGRAVTSLAIDLRGHGDSTTGPRDERITWESFGTDRERWAGTALDVLAAVQYLRLAGARRVVVVGSSIGGSAALLAATATLGGYVAPPSAEIDAVAMLSPGMDYHGLELADPMRRYLATRRPLLMFAAEGDDDSAAAVPALAPGNLPDVEAEVFAGTSAHGVSLCNQGPARWGRLDAWIRRVLGVPAANPPGALPRDS
jgi:pimeloyl-ACP methyl ester carboxylesterase